MANDSQRLGEAFAATRGLKNRRMQICVIGDGEAEQEILTVARDIGRRVAAAGAVLITGGHGGVMEGACSGAAEAGGTCVGILRSDDLSQANSYCNVVIATGIGHARNVLNVLSSDAVIAIGGGAGTLSEICFAWIHGRPIFILQGYGGWSDRLDPEIPLGPGRPTPMIFCGSVDEIFVRLADFVNGRL
jgi:uncharacterized protein (TIGR00725 family)